MASVSGLISREVSLRRKRGQGNDLDISSSRSYWDIIYHNVFNPIHIIFYLIGVVLVWMLSVRLIWRERWLERFLGIDF